MRSSPVTYGMSTKGNSLDIETRLVVARAWGMVGTWSDSEEIHSVFFVFFFF